MSDVLAGRSAGLGVGSSGFVAAHGLHTDAQRTAAGEAVRQIREADLRTIRLVVVDQHGVPRAKYLSSDAFVSALENGSDFSGAIYSLDTGNGVFPPPFAAGGGFGIDEMTGFPDITLVPDPTTFRVLPYADRTGWILSDPYFANGRPVPLDGRGLLRRQLGRLAERGLELYAGIEVELYVTRPARTSIGFDEVGQPGQPGTPLEVEVIERGYQFLSDSRMDAIGGALEAIRDGLVDVGIPPRSIENEWGPGQTEITFSPMEGLAAADAAILFRSTVKAICARLGLHATFMCWPGLPNFFPSGSHLHMSLLEIESGRNPFADDRELLSPTGRHFVAGLLDHAREMAVFGDPTTNAYARFRPYSFAPDRVCWSGDNRGALIRVQGGPGDAGTHLENRLSEPAANPYLWLAANIAAGVDGIDRRADPPDPVEGDPYVADAPLLPKSLAEAVDELEGSAFYREAFGDPLVDYLVMMKRSELARFDVAAGDGQDGSGQSAWEMREYFEFF
ncbi:MAG TPA: glutamine synthetase family protein [Gaiellales bacterium]|nr:glutamine synthetase family protein [Gaiellales bacterium]